jgi:hypothetical protein
MLFDFYKNLYQDEVALFLRAFIQKHRLFAENPDKEPDDSGLSCEELFRLLQMAKGMSDKSPMKQIKGE